MNSDNSTCCGGSLPLCKRLTKKVCLSLCFMKDMLKLLWKTTTNRAKKCQIQHLGLAHTDSVTSVQKLRQKSPQDCVRLSDIYGEGSNQEWKLIFKSSGKLVELRDESRSYLGLDNELCS